MSRLNAEAEPREREVARRTGPTAYLLKKNIQTLLDADIPPNKKRLVNGLLIELEDAGSKFKNEGFRRIDEEEYIKLKLWTAPPN